MNVQNTESAKMNKIILVLCIVCQSIAIVESCLGGPITSEDTTDFDSIYRFDPETDYTDNTLKQNDASKESKPNKEKSAETERKPENRRRRPKESKEDSPEKLRSGEKEKDSENEDSLEKSKEEKSKENSQDGKSVEREPKRGSKGSSTSTRAAITILQHLDIYDLNQMEVSTFRKLNPEALVALDDVKDRVPIELLRSDRSVSESTQAKGIAEMLNSLPPETITKIGPGWLDILPALSDTTWAELDDDVIENIPWRGIVANLDKSVWGEFSPTAVSRFPDRFFRYAPMAIWIEIDEYTFTQIELSKLQLIRQKFLDQLYLSGKFDFLSSSKLAALALE